MPSTDGLVDWAQLNEVEKTRMMDAENLKSFLTEKIIKIDT